MKRLTNAVPGGVGRDRCAWAEAGAEGGGLPQQVPGSLRICSKCPSGPNETITTPDEDTPHPWRAMDFPAGSPGHPSSQNSYCVQQFLENGPLRVEG